MNAVVTPLDPFPTGNQQNPLTFCDDVDYGSDGISYRRSDYSFENARPTVFSSSFHASGEVRPVPRSGAPVLGVTSEEETTTAMAPRGAIKLKRCSSTENKIDEISNTISTTSESDNGRSDENECEKDEKKLTFLTTHEDSASAQVTDAKPADFQIESSFVNTNYDNKDDGSPDNDKEYKEEVKEDSISDATSASALKKKRGSRRDRSQKSMKKRWKHLNAEDMGFQLSSLPRLPAVSDESKSDPTDECTTLDDSVEVEASNTESVLVETSTKRSDEDLTKADSSIEPVSSSAGLCEKEKGDHEAADDDEFDDVAFFASLGIDVHDSGETLHGDDIWQWDGVRFNNLSVLPSGSSKDSTDTTRRKSDMCLKPWPSGSHDKKYETNSHLINNKYVRNMSKRDVGILFDSGCTSSTKTYLRPDRHRKQMKCHKAVKSKHAKVSDVFHNPSKKQLYMHHRLMKIININVDFVRFSVPRRSQPTAMPKIKVAKDWIKGIQIKTYKAGRSAASQSTPIPESQPQNLHHALDEANVPVEFEMDLISFLLSVQNRELTPEDYEMLLRLDDSVKAKTISKNVLDSLKTETIGADDIIDTMCTICMEPYTAGQVRKFLPCQHDFHNECIDTWLNNSSQNCPLDGLPVVDS